MGLDLESRSRRTVNILGKLCTSLSVGGHKALPRETYPTSIEMIAEAFEVRQLVLAWNVERSGFTSLVRAVVC